MEKIYDALLKALKGIGVRVVSSFPMAEMEYPTVSVTLVSGDTINKSSVLSILKDQTTAAVESAYAVYTLLYQIDIFTKSSRERDKLMGDVLRILKDLRSPSQEVPLYFVKAMNIRYEDSEDEYRGIITARFYAFDVATSQEYIVQNTNAQISKEV